MKLPMFGLLAVAVLSASASAQAVSEAQKRTANEVIATVAKWGDAVRDRDLKTLDALFDDELIITTFDGRTRGKAEEMDAMKPNPNFRTTSVSNEDVALKLFGDVAVVTALTKMKMAAVGGRESSVALRYTAVLFKKDGNWRIVALQTARAPQTAPGS